VIIKDTQNRFYGSSPLTPIKIHARDTILASIKFMFLTHLKLEPQLLDWAAVSLNLKHGKKNNTHLLHHDAKHKTCSQLSQLQ